MEKDTIKNIIRAALLLFLTVAAIIISYSYINLLFLSSYPSSLLPYLYISQAAAVLFILFYSAPILSKNNNKYPATLQLILAITIIVFIALLHLHLYWVPFIFCTFLLAMEALIGVTSWNCASAAFNIREFKQLGTWLNISSNLGGLIAGISTTVIIRIFGSDPLLYILAAIMIASSILTAKLRRLPTIQPISKCQAKPSSYNLYKKIFLYVTSTVALYALIDYGFKIQLADNFTKAKIGEFTSLFFAATTGTNIILQFVGSKKILERYGVASLLLLMPIYWLIAAPGAFFYPGLITIVILAAGWHILNYSYNNLGIQLTLNVLPQNILQMGKFRLKAISFPIGVACSSLIMWVLGKYITLPIIAIITIISSIIIFYITYSLKKDYEHTLHKSIAFKRFGENISSPNSSQLVVVEQTAQHAINSDKDDMVSFGLSLLLKFPQIELNDNAIALVQAQNIDIRTMAVELMEKHRDQRTLKVLIKQLAIENNPAIIGKLLAAITQIDASVVIKQINPFLQNNNPIIKSAAILTIIAGGDIELLKIGLSELEAMISDPNIGVRQEAAKLLGSITIGNLTNELIKLINDKDVNVSISALNSASTYQPNKQLIDAISAKLANNKVAYLAVKTLYNYGNTAIPFILKLLNNKHIGVLHRAIKILALINTDESLQELIKIFKNGNVIQRYFIAKELALYSIKHSVAPQIKTASKHFALQEYKLINQLSAITNHNLPGYFIAEVNARIQLAKMCYVYWAAICTDPYKVLQILPIVTSHVRSDDKLAIAEKAKAIELLDTLTEKCGLSYTVKILEEGNYNKNSSINIENNKYLDDWLRMVLNYRPNTYADFATDNMQKVFVLRKNPLFATLLGEFLLFIAENTEAKHYHAKQTIFLDGDTPNGYFIIVSGTVLITKNNKIINTLGPNNGFGELALLDDSTRSASANAKTEVTTLYIDRKVFNKIISDVPDILLAITHVILGYLHDNLRRESNG